MKLRILTILIITLNSLLTAQIQVEHGPAIKNKRGNNLNKMFIGDDNSFYCYSIRSKGKGTSFYIDKYDQTSLELLYSTELDFDYSNGNKIEDVIYSQGRIYVFSHAYNPDSDKMVLYFQTVSAKGVKSENLKELLTLNVARAINVDFDISHNSNSGNFLVKMSYKKVVDSLYQTDFMLFESSNMNLLWKKTVDRKLFREDLRTNSVTSIFGAISRFVGMVDDEFIGMEIDGVDQAFCVVHYKKKDSTQNSRNYKLGVGLLTQKSNVVEWVDLGFENDYLIENVKFCSLPNNQLIVAGAFREKFDKQSSQPQKCGLFNFKIDLLNKIVVSKTTKVLDGSVVNGMEDDFEQLGFYKYKLDHIFPSGKDVLYVGELYKEEHRVVGYMINGNINKRPYFQYEYMNVVVAKLNENNEFQWVLSNPLRCRMVMNKSHVFKQYFAAHIGNTIYIVNNENEYNLEKMNDGKFSFNELKSFKDVEGSNCVTTSYSCGEASVKHHLNFKNESFLFNPIQERNFAFEATDDSEIFVVGNKGEIIIYTNDEEKERFTKLKIP